ncbi:MAG: TMEM175 family protein [Bryobacteraceae bacterium]
MQKNRLEAFSDGVLAIIITIMVLELKVPHGADWHSLEPMIPVFLSYVLSFLYVGIYWNNHHHLLHSIEHPSAGILWANLHLLFWLSLLPVGTAWAGHNHMAPIPVAAYGFVLLMAGVAYYVLQMAIIASHGPDSVLAKALGSDWKGKLSPLLYVVAIPLAFVHTAIANAMYVLVALLWVIPDRRIERALKERVAPQD